MGFAAAVFTSPRACRLRGGLGVQDSKGYQEVAHVPLSVRGKRVVLVTLGGLHANLRQNGYPLMRFAFYSNY